MQYLQYRGRPPPKHQAPLRARLRVVSLTFINGRNGSGDPPIGGAASATVAALTTEREGTWRSRGVISCSARPADWLWRRRAWYGRGWRRARASRSASAGSPP